MVAAKGPGGEPAADPSSAGESGSGWSSEPGCKPIQHPAIAVASSRAKGICWQRADGGEQALRRRAEQDQHPLFLALRRVLSRAVGPPPPHRPTASITTRQRLDSSGRGREKAADPSRQHCSSRAGQAPLERPPASAPGRAGTSWPWCWYVGSSRAGRGVPSGAGAGSRTEPSGPAKQAPSMRAPGGEPPPQPVGA